MTSFVSLFKKKEFQALLGKNYFNLKVMSAIFCLCLVAISFAIGGLNKLEKKMQNPFTNWLDLPLSFGQAEEGNDIVEVFEDASMLDSFDLNSVRAYDFIFRTFQHTGLDKKVRLKLRGFDHEARLVQEIVKRKNLIAQFRDDDEQMCGLIIKQESLKALGIEEFETQPTVELVSKSNSGIDKFYVPVIAVVKDLPNDEDVLISEHFFCLLYDSFSESNFIETGSKNDFYIASRDTDPFENKQTFNTVKQLVAPYSIEEYDLISTIEGGNEVYKLYLDSTISWSDRYKLKERLVSKIPSLDYYTPYECEVGQYLKFKKTSSLSFNFNHLKNVRKLNSYLKEEFGLEVSMDQIEDKENFYTVSWMTLIISVLLFVFGLVAVILFIYNLTKTHLEAMKTNLGTLKAFGLKNSDVIQYYTGIFTKFMMACLGLGFVASLLVYLLVNFVIQFVVPMHLFDVRIVLVVLIMLGVSLYTCRRVIKSTLDKTPGDLIYNR